MKVLLRVFSYLLLILAIRIGAYAHPMPNSMVVLNMHEKHISGQIQLPLSELQSAIGMAVNDNPERLIERLGDSLRIYLMKHIRPKSFEGKLWTVEISEMKVVSIKNILVGAYNELDIDFKMTPPQSYDLRNFYFDYDVILHQVASHRAMLNIKQDWQQGIVTEDSAMQQIGVIEWDVVNNKLPIFQVSLMAGSIWQGFKNMISLGIAHIKEGTDHILFVLTLLLPAMLLASDKRWGQFIGIKSSLTNIFKIVTSFTIGHSFTLILGSIQWLNFPTKPIEILIAVTILVSAFHAFRPIYPKKEILVAGGFGLIHGLAFSETLKTLELTKSQMVLSIFGFNIGIELMQIVIVLLIFPFLILLSRTKYYAIFRQTGAFLIMFMAFYWLVERF
jgi:hypothetical protein